MKVLVTGATGYIGGRLVPLLLERGHTVRIAVRDPQRLARRTWLPDVEVAVTDLFDADSVRKAVKGMDAAYYLVHSMIAGEGYAKRDRKAAHVLSAFATEQALILGHLEVNEKSNEIPAAQAMIKALALEGRLFTLDAMHCQKNLSSRP